MMYVTDFRQLIEHLLSPPTAQSEYPCGLSSKDGAIMSC